MTRNEFIKKLRQTPFTEWELTYKTSWSSVLKAHVPGVVFFVTKTFLEVCSDTSKGKHEHAIIP